MSPASSEDKHAFRSEKYTFIPTITLLENLQREGFQPVTAFQILPLRRYEDRQDDLWSVFNRCQKNLLKGGLQGRTAKGKRSHTRAVKGIDGDVKLNRALWVMAEELQQALS